MLSNVYTIAEATLLWKLGESTLRAAINNNRFIAGVEVRKSAGVWLITHKAMERMYGKKYNGEGRCNE